MVFQIYKSTKCNDMVQTGFCPRGAFCAFAHVERKLHVVHFMEYIKGKINYIRVSR